MMLSLCFALQNVRSALVLGEIVEEKIAGVSVKIHLEFNPVGGWRHNIHFTHTMHTRTHVLNYFLLNRQRLANTLYVPECVCGRRTNLVLKVNSPANAISTLITKFTMTFLTFRPSIHHRTYVWASAFVVGADLLIFIYSHFVLPCLAVRLWSFQITTIIIIAEWKHVFHPSQSSCYPLVYGVVWWFVVGCGRWHTISVMWKWMANKFA